MDVYALSIMILTVILLFQVAFVRASCDPYDESWHLCSQMDVCRQGMFIDVNGHDMDTFRELIHQHPANEQDMLNDIFCNDDLHGPQSRELWLLLMAHMNYCPDKNEFYVSGMGCMCKDNKICEYNASRNIFTPLSNAWFMGVLIAGTILLGAIALYKLRTLRKLFQTTEDACTCGARAAASQSQMHH